MSHIPFFRQPPTISFGLFTPRPEIIGFCETPFGLHPVVGYPRVAVVSPSYIGPSVAVSSYQNANKNTFTELWQMIPSCSLSVHQLFGDLIDGVRLTQSQWLELVGEFNKVQRNYSISVEFGPPNTLHFRQAGRITKSYNITSYCN